MVTRLGQYCNSGHTVYLYTCAAILLFISNYTSVVWYCFPRNYISFSRYIVILHWFLYCYKNANIFLIRILSTSLANILGLLRSLTKLNKRKERKLSTREDAIVLPLFPFSSTFLFELWSWVTSFPAFFAPASHFPNPMAELFNPMLPETGHPTKQSIYVIVPEFGSWGGLGYFLYTICRLIGHERTANLQGRIGGSVPKPSGLHRRGGGGGGGCCGQWEG